MAKASGTETKPEGTVTEATRPEARKKQGGQTKPAGKPLAAADKPAAKRKASKSAAPQQKKRGGTPQQKPGTGIGRNAGPAKAKAPERKPDGQGNAGGRRLKIKSVKAMQEAIDRYFDGTKTAVAGRDGTVSYVPGPYTVTGLALAIGLASRMSLLRYEVRPEFRTAVQRAKARVEEYAESRLYDHGASAGAKFTLANNFEGWREQAAPAGINLMIGSVEEAQRFLTGMAGLLEAVEKNQGLICATEEKAP